MATLLSPGVAWSEIDLTTIVPSLSTTVGGFAGNFNWGPVNEITTISNEIDLVNTFGMPDDGSYVAFFTAANFLSYTQNLMVVRAADLTGTRNATSGNQTIVIENKNVYDIEYMDGQAPANTGMYAARYPSDLGNGLLVSIWANTSNANAFSQWTSTGQLNSGLNLSAFFNGLPSTSHYVSSRGGMNDEMHIIVIDTLGTFTSTPNTVLEKYSYVSKAVDATNDDGTSNYYVNVINSQSKYIYILHGAQYQNSNTWFSDTTTWGMTAANTNFAQGNTNYTAILTGGNTAPITDGALSTAYSFFGNSDVADVSLMMMGNSSPTVTEYVLSNVTESRKDHVLFVSPQFNDVVNNMGNETTSAIATRNMFGSSSYTVFDSGWKKQFDKYNNVYRWIPLNGDIAGLCAQTDYTNAAWWSPAGLNRGLIKNVTQLSWSPNQADRDNLYKNSINPVVQMNGVGTVLYGDKTMTAKPSAFDRINVRRLFITLEQSISKAAKYSLFEFNDEFTRAQFVALVDPFLRDIKGKRGIFDYQIVCDTTNNTPEVIDSNRFVGDIYIKPARAINFIQLNFIAVGTGVAFSEVVGKTGA